MKGGLCFGIDGTNGMKVAEYVDSVWLYQKSQSARFPNEVRPQANMDLDDAKHARSGLS